MIEKEKMLRGELYNSSSDKDLVEDRARAKDLCFELNNTKPSDIEKRKSIFKKLFNKTGENFHIESNFWCDYGYRIEIGENFYANHNVVMLDAGGISFGDNVWIGAGVHVCPGVTIRDNVVIGAGSVVVRDIPDNSIAVGDPCRVIKKID